MTDFKDFSLPGLLLEAIERLKFTTPTPIQEKSIPLALGGQDILGSAQTGTGKTAAFAIPLIVKLMENPKSTALVLTPTRELAVQVIATIKDLTKNQPAMKSSLLIGGEPMFKQLNQLRGNPQIIVGTPGRINDHLRRKSLSLGNTHMLVLDETDRMLDMGFGVQLEEIAKHLPSERQTLLFSATLPKTIVKLADKYLSNPTRIAIGSTTTPIEHIKQEIIQTTDEEKPKLLMEHLAKREGSIIVFVKTKRGADRLAQKLAKTGEQADALHGDLKQSRRARVIKAFRDKRYRVLVATDVAARGLDIPHIEHVINFDLPQCPEDYIHRIGRTARAGAKGEALCLVTPADKSKWRAIHHFMNGGEEASGEGIKSHRNGPRKGKAKPFSGKKFAGKQRFAKKPSNGFGNGQARAEGEQNMLEKGERPDFNSNKKHKKKKSFEQKSDAPRAFKHKSPGKPNRREGFSRAA